MAAGSSAMSIDVALSSCRGASRDAYFVGVLIGVAPIVATNTERGCVIIALFNAGAVFHRARFRFSSSSGFQAQVPQKSIFIVCERNIQTKQGVLRRIFPVFASSGHHSAHFLDVEGYGKEGKVHCDFVFAKVTEAAVCHVVLHLAEHGLRLYASLPSVLDSFF